jgi:hypothetical protein
VTRRLLLSLGWVGMLAAFVRWWEIGNRAPGLALWSCLYMVAFGLTLWVARGPDGLNDRGERARLAGWVALIVLALAGHAILDRVAIRGVIVHTVVFVKVLDTVVPFWILVRALMVIWTGPARVIATASLIPAVALGGWLFVVAMPGHSFAGPLLPLSANETALQDRLRHDVERLAPRGPGERSHRYPALLEGAARWLDSSYTAAGYRVVSLPYAADSQRFRNLEITIPGTSRASEVVVIGAHYDAVEGAPGADDNASGTAALLALARAFAGQRFARTVRLVAFVNEEPPYFDGPAMGSRVYAAQASARGDHIVAMVSLETLGYFVDAPQTQRYPFPFNLVYPDRGSFLAFVGNLDSRPLVRRAIASFRRAALFPSEGAAAPSFFPGIGWSDHESFWLHGWQAIMITDTGPFRNPHYHMSSDTPDRLDYARMARAVTGLRKVVEDLAGG